MNTLITLSIMPRHIMLLVLDGCCRCKGCFHSDDCSLMQGPPFESPIHFQGPRKGSPAAASAAAASLLGICRHWPP